MSLSKDKVFLASLLSLIISILYILSLNFISFPWVDEIGTSDTPINFVLHGRWESDIWWYTYNPLHAFILVGWLFLFGISHLSVCSLNVVIAYLVSIILIRLLSQYLKIDSILVLCSFVLFFWGGYVFSGTIIEGRIDILTLFFVTLFIIEVLLRHHETGHWYRLSVYSFFVMTSAIYPIPLLLLLSIVVYIVANNDGEKKYRLKEAIIMLIAFALSFMLICMFYLYNNFLFRFLNTYISFNATLSAHSVSFLERLLEAYLIDVTATALLLVSFFLLKNKNFFSNRMHITVFVFICCIPFIMTAAGRYRPYYGWMYYMPSIVILMYSTSLYGKRLKTFILFLSLMMFVYKPLSSHKEWTYKYQQLNHVSSFLDDNNSILSQTNNIVFLNAMCYYPLLKYSKRLYYSNALEDIPSPTEKFQLFANKLTRDKNDEKKLVEYFKGLEDQRAYDLPASGLIVITDVPELVKTKSYLSRHGIPSNEVVHKGDYVIINYHR